MPPPNAPSPASTGTTGTPAVQLRRLRHAAVRVGTKFDAGCGWPSYSSRSTAKCVERVVDASHGMVRMEVRCNRCGSHLGHVFEDGPEPTGERFCINSAAINFEPSGSA
jgi:methionine-R-sulfoxide reductase